MAGPKRVALYLRKSADNVAQLASFSDCLLDFFCPGGQETRVSCQLEDNRLTLGPPCNIIKTLTPTSSFTSPPSLSLPSSLASPLSSPLSSPISPLSSPSSCGPKFCCLPVESGKVAPIVADESTVELPVSPFLAESCVLTHPPFCPLHCISSAELSEISPDVLERGIGIGVVAVLESSDSRVLLTRRADHMRTFPRTWVPPGGHIELDETLEEATLRELKEETGLSSPTLLDTSLLCMWESVYPFVLGMGKPSRHHIVIYFHIRVAETSEQLDRLIHLDPEEVGASTWIDRKTAEIIATGVAAETSSDLKITVVNKDGVQSPANLPTTVMAAQAPTSGPDIERVSTGTRYAMEQWLKKTTVIKHHL